MHVGAVQAQPQNWRGDLAAGRQAQRLPTRAGRSVLLATRRAATGKGILFASWNGATGVSHWAVHAGQRPSDLRAVGVAESHGFETVIPLPTRDRYVRATPLDATGRVLATSDVVRV